VISLKSRADLHEWARGNKMTDEDEELAEVWARHLISKHIYDDDEDKQSQVVVAESRLPEANKGLQWNDFEVLCAKTLCAILDSKKEACAKLFIGGRRSMNSTKTMWKMRMFLFLL
jgi:hypothetical protein